MAGIVPSIATLFRAIATSTKGPAAGPAGFHQVALLSFATATNAPPMPSARVPTVSMVWADAGVDEMARRNRQARRRRERRNDLTNTSLSVARKYNSSEGFTGALHTLYPFSRTIMIVSGNRT